MTAELAGSSFAGEPAMLEAQGINVLQYVMLPRCIGLALSVETLSVFFCRGLFCSHRSAADADDRGMACSSEAHGERG